MAMASKIMCLPLVVLILLLLTIETEAFGAGYVARGSRLKGSKYRHGDIALAVPLLAVANRRIVKQIYFGNWLRDFSQLIDRGSLALVPRPLLRVLVSVFAYVQFGYATREFEVTDERLGLYRPEEHVDNPRGYQGSSETVPDMARQDVVEHGMIKNLRPQVHPVELDIDPNTGMKNYIANSRQAGQIHSTSADYVETQLIAAITLGRQGEEEAYIHLGAALHCLDDFLAHSNYVELAMQMIGQEIGEQTERTLALEKVFAFVGEGAKIKTTRGVAAPISTGTFGALDLVQTLLGEIEDRASAVSLPGLRLRTSGDEEGPLKDVAKYLIGVLAPVTASFEVDILKIQKAAGSGGKPASWGELEKQPEKLWESIEPVLKLRDDVAKWVNDHLKIRAVQDALATISTAVDRFVYFILGSILSPLLSEFTRVLKDQEQRLLLADQRARSAAGEQSIFDADSTMTDPTHSQLAKDHYDHALNEIAGRVAVQVASYTITAIIQLWQPGNTQDPRVGIQSVLEVFHHPFNCKPDSMVQVLMLKEVRGYIRESLNSDPQAFESTLHSLSASAVASRIDPHCGGHTHVDVRPTSAGTGTHGSSMLSREHSPLLTYQLSENIKDQLNQGKIKGKGIADFAEIEKMLFADPSGDSPNPLDSALSTIPGLSFLDAFQGIEMSQIAAVEGIGETLKDAIVTMVLLDETRGAHEEEIAASKFGMGKHMNKKEQKARLKELTSLLELKRIYVPKEEEKGDDGLSMGEKLKLKMEKLKLKARS